jgi:putative heme-binding domain-containing protein
LLKASGRDTEWTYDELAPSVRNLAAGRSFDVGKMAFQLGNCIACHRLDGRGNEFGPDLAKLDAEKNSPDRLLRSLIEPSHEIDEKYLGHTLLLESGKIVTGMVVAETAATVSVIVDPVATPEPMVINKAEIEERQKACISLMPTGLLGKLTREEIWDLIAYVHAKADKQHPLFRAAEPH